MLLVILFILIGLVAMLATFAWFNDDGAPIIGTLGALFVGGLVFGVWAGVSAIITYNTDPVNLTKVAVQSRDLRALDTGTDNRGSFFLGSGYTESGPAYTYLFQNEDGGYEMRSVETRNAIVYQTDDEEPRVETGRVRPTNRWWSIFEISAKHVFYVPEGSVQQPEYRVNVER